MRRLSTSMIMLLATPAAAQLSVTKPTPLEMPVTMAPHQGALLVAFRRPDGWSAGKSGTIAFARYDPAPHDMIARPKDAKKNGDTNTYWIQVSSKDRKAALEYRLMLVSAGFLVVCLLCIWRLRHWAVLREREQQLVSGEKPMGGSVLDGLKLHDNPGFEPPRRVRSESVPTGF